MFFSDEEKMATNVNSQSVYQRLPPPLMNVSATSINTQSFNVPKFNINFKAPLIPISTVPTLESNNNNNNNNDRNAFYHSSLPHCPPTLISNIPSYPYPYSPFGPTNYAPFIPPTIPLNMPPIASFNIPSYIPLNNDNSKKTKKKAQKKKKSLSPKRRKQKRKKMEMDNEEPWIPIKGKENEQNINTNSLPLGHPKRIIFKDTMSEAFHHKFQNQKRTVSHRRWARAKKCIDCNITYPSTDDYELHRMIYHSEGIQIDHLCPICKLKYNERRWLNRHVRNAHFKFQCKIDGHGVNHLNVPNKDLKKKKGKKVLASDIDNICGFRFSQYEDLAAHQAIHHGVINEFVQHSGDQGPTIKYMNGTDAKDIVIERFVWNQPLEKKKNVQHKEENMNEQFAQQTPKRKKRKKNLSKSSSKQRKKSKSKSPKKRKKKIKDIDLTNQIVIEPPKKKRKVSL